MGFSDHLGGSRRSAGAMCLRWVGLCLKSCLALLALAGLALALLVGRLMQGPLDLPPVARLTAEIVNARMDNAVIEIGGAALTLGRNDAASGLAFHDVRVATADGTLLLSAPELSARFLLSDLVFGRLQPTRMVLRGARGRVVRDLDGRVRVGLGTGEGLRIAGGGTGRAGADAVRMIIDGFVGDTAPVPLLERLRHIAVLDAVFTYQDAISGRAWTTRGSDLRLSRSPAGARAVMRVSLSDEAAAATEILVRARRARGTRRTEVDLVFDNLRPGDLAAQASALGWARLFEAELSGEIALEIAAEGLGAVGGVLRAGPGRLAHLPRPLDRFDRMRLDFQIAPGLRDLEIGRFEVAGEGLSVALSGDVAVVGPDVLAPGALDLQLMVHDIAADLPEIFAGPLRFSSGQAVARLELDPLAITHAAAHLSEDGLTLSATGEARDGPDGWEARLRATAEGLTVATLKSHWPLQAAANARDWVAENLVSGRMSDLVAQIALGGGAPRLALDFRYQDLVSRYLGELPPITDARGTGHLTLDTFDLSLSSGRVTPPGRASLELGPSTLAVRDLQGAVTPAEIDLRGSGPTASVLGLIDAPPLSLVSKLGLGAGEVAGRAEVTTRLAFPLIDALRLEEIEIAAAATLSDLATRLDVAGAERAISGRRLELTASAEEMQLTGPVRIDGAPFELAWREFYGAREGRELVLDGALTPAILAAEGVPAGGFDAGSAPMRLSLEQVPGRATAIDLALDLTPAKLAIAPLRWAKAEGVPGRLSLSAAIDETIAVEALSVEAGDLALDGALRLDASGGLASAEIARLTIAERADLSGRLTRGADGVPVIALTGALLDLSRFIDTPMDDATEDRGPMRLTANVERLVLTPKLKVAPAEARLTQSDRGTVTVELEGRAGGRTPFRARYRRRSGEPAVLRMTTEDTGGLLGALGLFQGGLGGDLILDARLMPDSETDVAGTAEIREMRVRRSGTFGEILEEGGAAEAASAVQGEGLGFDTITIPFRYSDGRLSLDEAIARSPMLAVKVEGEVIEAEDRVDLAGVISPAYALTGALDRVPLIGRLLSGGEGEGILAMTFQVSGTLDDPDFTVNPLSLLTPGFLRSVFSGRTGKPSQSFMDQLENQR